MNQFYQIGNSKSKCSNTFKINITDLQLKLWFTEETNNIDKHILHHKQINKPIEPVYKDN